MKVAAAVILLNSDIVYELCYWKSHEIHYENNCWIKGEMGIE